MENILDQTTLSIHELKEIVSSHFSNPKYQVTSPKLDSKLVQVKKGMALVNIKVKNNQPNVSSSINNNHPASLVAVGSGVAIGMGTGLGFVGMFLAILTLTGAVYLVSKSERDQLELEINELLSRDL